MRRSEGARALRDIRRSTRATQMTIYFWAPDVSQPSGGIRVIYRFADALNAAAIPAAVMHQRNNFRATWFPNETRVVAAQATHVFGDDVLVVSELDAPRLLDKTPGIAKVILNQAHYWTFLHGRVDYRRPDVAAMIVVSTDGERYMRHAYPGLELLRVRLGVDADLFQPSKRREQTVLHHPTKGGLGRELVLSTLHMRGALDGWNVESVSGLSQPELAAKLGRSAALLTAAQEEAFPLLLIEAMAAGCAVIGYHAGGGAEYLTPDVAWPVPTGDHLALSHTLGEFIGEWAHDRESIEARTSKARSLVEREYNLAQEARDVACALGPVAAQAAGRPPGKGLSVVEMVRFETARSRARASVRALLRG